MNRTCRMLLAIACFMLASVSVSHSRTWYIKADGTGDAPTIQAGIESAAQDDTVLVGPGVYSWSSQGTGDDYGMIRIMRDWPAMTIVSEQGPAMTILDGENQGRVFFYQGHYPDFPGGLTIDGFTFTHAASHTTWQPGRRRIHRASLVANHQEFDI